MLFLIKFKKKTYFSKVRSKYRNIGKRFNVRLNIRKSSDYQCNVWMLWRNSNLKFKFMIVTLYLLFRDKVTQMNIWAILIFEPFVKWNYETLIFKNLVFGSQDSNLRMLHLSSSVIFMMSIHIDSCEWDFQVHHIIYKTLGYLQFQISKIYFFFLFDLYGQSYRSRVLGNMWWDVRNNFSISFKLLIQLSSNLGDKIMI